MTNYFFGDVDSRIGNYGENQNSFRPSFEHSFYEYYPESYLEISKEGKNGGKILYYYDTERCRYIHDEKEIDRISKLYQ